jgi:DnaJ-class molecular chaperone
MTDIARCEFCAGLGEFAGRKCDKCGGRGFRSLITDRRRRADAASPRRTHATEDLGNDRKK